MADIKNTFIKGKMNKDLDSRVVPEGEYREGTNIQILNSEGSDVGAVQSIHSSIRKGGTNSLFTDIGGSSVEGAVKLIDLTAASEIVGNASTFNDGTYTFCKLIGGGTQGWTQLITGDGYGTGFCFRIVISSNAISSVTATVSGSDFLNFPNVIQVVQSLSNSMIDNGSSAYFQLTLTEEHIRPYKPEVIGFYINNANNRFYWFVTDYDPPGDDLDKRVEESTGAYHCAIYELGENATEIQCLVKGEFLNFSKQHHIHGINMVDNLLFWTDNRNQPRKIHVDNAKSDATDNLTPTFYTIEDQISVAKYYPWKAPRLIKDLPTYAKNNYTLSGSSTQFNLVFENKYTKAVDDTTTLYFTVGGAEYHAAVTSIDDSISNNFKVTVGQTYNASNVNASVNIVAEVTELRFISTNTSMVESNDVAVDDNYLKERFVKFAYRFKFNDNEYSLLSPFSQACFIPEFYKPGVENNPPNLTSGGIESADVADNEELDAIKSTDLAKMINYVNQLDLHIDLDYKLKDLYDELHVTHIEVVMSEANNSTLRSIVSKNVKTDTTDHPIFSYTYKSTLPYKVLPEREITRVFDNVPVKAGAQEITGNRIIYGNITLGSDVPSDIDYSVTTTERTSTTYNLEREYPTQSLKQRRTYQVGLVLADKYGRQSSVILPTTALKATQAVSSHSSGSATVTLTGSNAGILIGMTVTGTNVPGGITVANINGTALTLSSVVNAVISGTLTFVLYGGNDTVYKKEENQLGDSSGNILTVATGALTSSIITHTTIATPTSGTAGPTTRAFTTDGDGTGATIQLTVVDGVVTVVSVTVGGTGYAAGDKLTFASSLIGGSTNLVIELTGSEIGYDDGDGYCLATTFNSPINTATLYNTVTNPLGWYSYKLVVKQTEQEYYNVYAPGLIKDYPLGNKRTWLTLHGDNINKVPRSLEKNANPDILVSPSEAILFPKVINTESSGTFTNIGTTTGFKKLKVISIGTQKDNALFSTSTTVDPIFYESDKNHLLAELINSFGIDETEFTQTLTPIKNNELKLCVLETEPFESALDIYYETSTSGLITDLNTSISTGTTISSINVTNNSFPESTAANTFTSVKMEAKDPTGTIVPGAVISVDIKDKDGTSIPTTGSTNALIVAQNPSDSNKYTLKVVGPWYYNNDGNTKKFTLDITATNSGDIVTRSVDVNLSNIDVTLPGSGFDPVSPRSLDTPISIGTVLTTATGDNGTAITASTGLNLLYSIKSVEYPAPGGVIYTSSTNPTSNAIWDLFSINYSTGVLTAAGNIQSVGNYDIVINVLDTASSQVIPGNDEDPETFRLTVSSPTTKNFWFMTHIEDNDNDNDDPGGEQIYKGYEVIESHGDVDSCISLSNVRTHVGWNYPTADHTNIDHSSNCFGGSTGVWRQGLVLPDESNNFSNTSTHLHYTTHGSVNVYSLKSEEDANYRLLSCHEYSSDIIEDGYQDIDIEFKDIWLWIDDSTLVNAISPATGDGTKKLKITLTEENPSSTGDRILIQNLYHEWDATNKPTVDTLVVSGGKRIKLHRFKVNGITGYKSLTDVIEGAATYQHNNSNSNVAYSTYAPQAYSILGVPGYGGAQGVAPKYMMRERYIYNLKVEFEDV